MSSDNGPLAVNGIALSSPGDVHHLLSGLSNHFFIHLPLLNDSADSSLNSGRFTRTQSTHLITDTDGYHPNVFSNLQGANAAF